MKNRMCVSCLILVLLLCACSPAERGAGELATLTAQALTLTVLAPTHTPTFTSTPPPSHTPSPTPPPTVTSTITPKPTRTLTPTPAETPLGGMGSKVMLFRDFEVVWVSLADPTDYDTVVSVEDLVVNLELDHGSGMTSDSISPDGKLAAFWNCDTQNCDTKKGILYLFDMDFKHQNSLSVPGQPYFLGWSAKQDRLLYYLSSTMSDDYYLLITQGEHFGETIPLGRMSHVSWAPDHRSLFTQKGDKVTQIDLEGEELASSFCQFANACIHAPSPDGKRFAGIQKFLPTGTSNPTIVITPADFSESKVIHVSDDDVAVLGLSWMPDSRRLIAYGITTRQSVHRFAWYDYLAVIDVDSGEERVIDLNAPDDTEQFTPCGPSPDGTMMVYLNVRGRVKSEGRLYFSGRTGYMFTLSEDTAEWFQVTDFSEAWESCPVWVRDH